MAILSSFINVAAVLITIVGLFSYSSKPVAGMIECEKLPSNDCAFAVASSGARCVLEKEVHHDGTAVFKCQTSIIMAELEAEWIETDNCVATCGLDRLSVGLSTDAFMEHEFTKKLCLSDCRFKCPNIHDLYTKLAAGEGIHLPTLCESMKPKPRRFMPASKLEAQAFEKVGVESATGVRRSYLSAPTASPTLALPGSTAYDLEAGLYSKSKRRTPGARSPSPHPATNEWIQPPSHPYTEQQVFTPSSAPQSPSYAPAPSNVLPFNYGPAPITVPPSYAPAPSIIGPFYAPQPSTSVPAYAPEYSIAPPSYPPGPSRTSSEIPAAAPAIFGPSLYELGKGDF